MKRFWDKVDIRGEDECWEWTASTNTGYGQIGIGGRPLLAHRVAWELAADRKIPKGLYVCHSCDNRLCCNPAHLWLGTHKQNMEDMAAKGRSIQGEKHHNAKLTTYEVAEIFLDPSPNKEIAEKFGVTPRQIRKIKGGDRWSHITERLIN